MSIPASKSNKWGCRACYSHQKNNFEEYCKLARKKISKLKGCPIGNENYIIDKGLYNIRKIANSKVSIQS